jgi:hypothetical protein
MSRPAVGPTQPSVQCDVDLSAPSSAEVKIECLYTLLVHNVFMDRDNFIFYIFGVADQHNRIPV